MTLEDMKSSFDSLMISQVKRGNSPQRNPRGMKNTKTLQESNWRVLSTGKHETNNNSKSNMKSIV